MNSDITVKIGGKKRTFRFGINAHMIYERTLMKMEISDLGVIIALFYAGLKAKEAVNSLPDDFSLETVGDWIDDMSEQDYEQVLEKGMEAFQLAVGKRKTVAMNMLVKTQEKNTQS